jgi:hypothetical protein
VKKIGNIVSTKQKVNVSDRFNVVTSLDDCYEGIPTLIVGYEYACGLFPDTELIIKTRKIDENTHWTFTKSEAVREYESDIELFVNFCYEKLQSDIIYFFIDIVHLSHDSLVKTYDKLKSIDKLIGYIHDNRMIYLYGDGIIFGFDLELSKFTGKDPEKVKENFSALANGLITQKELPEQYNDDMFYLNNGLKYTPYLCYLDELDNNS